MNRSERSQDNLGETFRWVVESGLDQATAAADWLARDIDARYDSAFDLLTDEGVALETLRRAKDVYKTMRVVGETPADRRLGARLYAASIAAALARHGERISTQSDAAILRSLSSLAEEQCMPDGIRSLAGTALCHLRHGG